MAELHTLPARRDTGSLQHVSTALKGLLENAGYKPIAPNREKEALATAAVAILTGSYRRDEAALPEIRTEALIAVLAEYPDDCIRYVTDPRTGIQSFHYSVFDHNGREVKGKFKGFPPEPGELQEACEKYMAPVRRHEEQERREREAIEARRREEALAEGRRVRPTLVDLRASVGLLPPIAHAIDDAAARIMGQIAHGERARRVEMDLAERRVRREASAP